MFTVSMIFNKYLISFYRAHNSGHVNLVTDGVIFRIDLFFLSIIDIHAHTHSKHHEVHWVKPHFPVFNRVSIGALDFSVKFITSHTKKKNTHKREKILTTNKYCPS